MIPHAQRQWENPPQAHSPGDQGQKAGCGLCQPQTHPTTNLHSASSTSLRTNSILVLISRIALQGGLEELFRESDSVGQCEPEQTKQAVTMQIAHVRIMGEGGAVAWGCLF